MLQTRRSAIRLGRQLRSQPQRREASNDASGTESHHAAEAGKAEPVHHASHPHPVNESLGRGFWVTLAAVPVAFALYKVSLSSEDPAHQPWLTRVINSYDNWQKQYEERNTLHTKMVEQAAFDRNLFQSAQGSRMIDLRFPEVFNTGSPYNIPAGHSVDLSALIAHYQKKNQEADARWAEQEANRKGTSLG